MKVRFQHYGQVIIRLITAAEGVCDYEFESFWQAAKIFALIRDIDGFNEEGIGQERLEIYLNGKKSPSIILYTEKLTDEHLSHFSTLTKNRK